MSALTVDIQERVYPRPFRRFQNTVLTPYFPFNAAGGFDIAVVGFIAPPLKSSPARSAP
jgi:hypothetical protein